MKIRDLEQYRVTMYDVKAQLKRAIYRLSEEAFARGDRDRDAIRSGEQLEARKTLMREKLIESLGGLPPLDTPLNAQVTGTVRCDGFRIEKIIFESRPHTYVTCNLYLPDGLSGPQGAVLFLCGHHDMAKHQPEYQSVCQYLVRAGLIVLAMDPIGQGERLSYYESSLKASTLGAGTGEHGYAGSQCLPLGDSLARYFVHDAMRAIDYLLTRPEVDPAKIGVTGNSGGGTQTSLVMVCEPRIAAAAPATFIMNRRTYMYAGGAQDSEQIWPGMSALGFDHEDILLAMAPKPVRVLAVTYDFFPIEGTRETVSRVRRFWDMYGKAGDIDLVEDESTHKYTPALARAAAEFFSERLNGRKVSPPSGTIRPLDPPLLWCTPAGQVREEFPDARAVHEENADRLRCLEEARTALDDAKRKERALAWLRDRVFAARKPCALNPRHAPMGRLEELCVRTSLWWSHEGVFNHALTFTDFRREGETLPLTIAVWDRGTRSLHAHWDWIRKTCSSGRAVMVLDVSGVGPLTPHSLNSGEPQDYYGILYKLADDLLWLNDSMAAWRTYDVIRAVDLAVQTAGVDAQDIALYAGGRQGMYAQLASALDERVKSLEVAEGMASVSEWVAARHYDSHDISSVILPGMLRYFDLPDLRRWCAR